MNTSTFFDSYFNNAQVNAMLILDLQGTILRVNSSFTRNFSYNPEQLIGRPFSELFTETDQEAGKPARELERVRITGQAADENYIIDGQGHPLWCAGEVILVADPGGISFIIKDVINLQAKKQLQLFLQDTANILENIFQVSADLPMMILDTSLKVEKANVPFLKFFNLTQVPVPGTRLAHLEHPFWQGQEIKNEISDLLVTGEPLRSRQMVVESLAGSDRLVRLDLKVIDRPNADGKKIFIILEPVDTVPA